MSESAGQGRTRVRGTIIALVAICGCVGLSYAATPAAQDARPPFELSPSTQALLGIQPSRYPSPIDYRGFESRLNRMMAAPDMVGMGVAVVENGRVTFVKGFGTTTANGTEPVGVHTVFRWASLSKGVAATLVGELANDGDLKLTDPIARYSVNLHLPNGNEQRATVADVLSHRLGIAKNAYDDRLEQGMDPHIIRTQLSALKQYCAPGTCHQYQNVAFDSTSELVEKVTGKPYGQEVEERLFRPLGMYDASVSRAGLMSSRSWARPHVGRTTVTVKDNYYRVPAAGGVNSSIFDLARWMQAQMGAASNVVPQTVLDVIHQPRVFADRRNGDFNRAMGVSQYGLGWRDYIYQGHRLIGHQGAVSGYRSTILFDPARQTGVVVLWNSQSRRPVGVQLEIFDMLYGFPYTDWMKVEGAQASAT